MLAYRPQSSAKQKTMLGLDPAAASGRVAASMMRDKKTGKRKTSQAFQGEFRFMVPMGLSGLFSQTYRGCAIDGSGLPELCRGQ